MLNPAFRHELTADDAEAIRAFMSERARATAYASSLPEDRRTDFARALCKRLLGIWWDGTSSLIPSAGMPIRAPFVATEEMLLDESAERMADAMGAIACAMHPEVAAFNVGSVYTRLIPKSVRTSLGVFYTPPVLAERLLDLADASGVRWRTARALDPACGGGAFLAPIARRMVSALHGQDPKAVVESVARRLEGYEIDPFAAWISQVALDAAMLPMTTQARISLPVLVQVRDALEAPEADFDLVVANPPYSRTPINPARRERFARGLSGHANLYGLFADLALRLVRNEGVVALLTPTSFLSGAYSKNLRRVICEEAAVRSIDFVSVRRNVFEDVLQETCLAVYQKGGRREEAAISEVIQGPGGELATRTIGGFRVESAGGAPWILPRRSEETAIVRAIRTMPGDLAAWGYRVSTGPLVWNRRRDGLREAFEEGCLPLLWAEAVSPKGGFAWSAMKRRTTRWFMPNGRDGSLILATPAVLVQRTSAKEQKRRLVAASLPADFLEEHGGAVAENHLNVIRPALPEPLVSTDVMAAVLNSRAADRVFRCLSGSVAVSASELSAMPLPAAASLSPLVDTVEHGASRDEIEKICDEIFFGSATVDCLRSGTPSGRRSNI